MSGEQKLGLIVAFGVMLLVFVLLSEYMSEAGRAQLEDVTQVDQVSMAASAVPLVRPLEAPGVVITPPARPEQVPGGGSLIDDLANGVSDGVRDGLDGIRSALADLPGGLEATVIEQGGRGLPEIVVKPRGGELPEADDTTWATYTVKARDTLSSIAAAKLGSTGRWRELLEANLDRIKDPDRVPVGTVLRLPGVRREVERPVPVRPAKPDLKPDPKPDAKPEVGATRQYVVKKGDTLSLIAQRELGTVRRLDELRKLNAGVLKGKDEVRVGMKLTLPAKR